MQKSSKTPQEKKALSLARDSRNSYGENAKASRKLIPLNKQLSHQATRRAVAQALRPTKEAACIDAIDGFEARAKTAGIKMRRDEFVKQADISLGLSIERKKNSRLKTFKNYGPRPSI